MGLIRPPSRVKLFVGMLSADRDLMRRSKQLLCRFYGEVALESEFWPFQHTDYYVHELGSHAERHFVAFRDLIQPDAIAAVKRQTNDIEQTICDDLTLCRARRPVNLDPGYLDLNKIVLASTKAHAHRIYLQRGIYAEVTLLFQKRRWQSLPWTYPDFASGNYDDYFSRLRELLKEQIANSRSTEE